MCGPFFFLEVFFLRMCVEVVSFLAPGSETHTAAGAVEHSLQRNGQVSDAAQRRGAGTVSQLAS